METATLQLDVPRPAGLYGVRWGHAKASSSSLETPVQTREPGISVKVEPLGFWIDAPTTQPYRRWVVSGATEPARPLLPRAQPEVTIHRSARGLLTDKVRETVHRLLEVLAWQARKHFMPVTKFEVGGFVDPEEAVEEVVVTQWLRVSEQAALDYWDRLGSAVEAWIDFLPSDLGEIAIERLAIEVRGGEDDRTT